MSIEQTPPLLQLLLNSVLLSLGCLLSLGRFSTRSTYLDNQISALLQQGNELSTARRSGQLDAAWETRLLPLKRYLRQLQRRQRLVHNSQVAVHYALLLSIGSTFLLSLRSLLEVDGLVSLSLGLFVLSVAALLVGAGCALIELHHVELQHVDRFRADELANLLISESRNPQQAASRTRATRQDKRSRRSRSSMRARVS